MPGSTYSTNLKIELIPLGEQSGTWGNTNNTNLGTALEQAIVGYGDPATPIFPTDGDATLTMVDSNASQTARNFALRVTSSVNLTATRNLIVPAIQKPYLIFNNTSGSQSIVVKTSAGTGVTVANGARVPVYVDGTNVVAQDIPAASTAVTQSPGTANTTIATTAFVQAVKESLYPVGSIYTNAAVSTNPATLLGFGTWAAFGAGRVMVGLDAGNAAFDTVEETGGSANAIVVSHTHTITDPGHTHPPASGASNFWNDAPAFTGQGTTAPPYLGQNSATGSATTGITVDSAGSSGTNANLQPYIVVYMWKRTA